jgi:pyochelin biosynthetic protein PchC
MSQMADAFPKLWFRKFKQAQPEALTLICLPHAGGVAGNFYDLASRLSPQVEVLSVQYPGRQDRLAEPPMTDPRRLAGAILDALPPSPMRPIALFGHSYGAILAYEIAQGMIRRNDRLHHVFLSAHGPQRVPRPNPIHTLEGEDFIASIAALGGQGADFLRDPAFAELVMPTLYADLQAAETYCIADGPLLPVPISALCGRGDHRSPRSHLEGWRAFAGAGFDLRSFDGGHLYLTQNVETLADYISKRLFTPE